MRLLALTLLMAAVTPALAQPSTGAQAVAHGKALYDQHCTACHGADASAGERAPAIVLDAPASSPSTSSSADMGSSLAVDKRPPSLNAREYHV